jgi:hypothetical protein
MQFPRIERGERRRRTFSRASNTISRAVMSGCSTGCILLLSALLSKKERDRRSEGGREGATDDGTRTAKKGLK